MATVSGLPHDVRITFPAKFDSNCRECSQAIYEGDPIGFVDDVCVCGDCHEAASRENRAALREQVQAQRELDRAEDPEKFDRQQAAVKSWLDRVRAKAAQEDGKEWVTSPEGSGWVRNPDHEPAICPRCNLTVPCDCDPEPPTEQEAPVAVEPGIQALMAAGLLEGQEPGGSGVCVAEIHAAGKVTEVEIPVPVDPQGLSVDSTEAPGDQADRADQYDAHMRGQLGLPDRQAELAQAAAEWTPEQAQRDALQASLQAAVDAGTLTPAAAAGLGWTPRDGLLEIAGVQFTKHAEPAVIAESPRIQEAREQFRADPVRAPADIFLEALGAATTAAEEDAILGALDSLPAYIGRNSMEAEKRDLLGVIVGAINNHPRSLQVKIGPSEIGTECDHCLAAKLAGWEETERGEAWLPTVGTAVHSWIEEAFKAHPDGPNGTRRYLTETRVAVGEIDGEEVTGSTDLADVVAGWTWDWKIVGPTTLKSAKVRPSPRYVVQQMLYGRGWNRLGVKITHVGIAYLPRNAMSLASAVWWSAPYDEQIALDALDRASNIARNLKAMAAIGGTEARDKYITGLDRWRTFTAVVDGSERAVTGNSQEGRIVCMDCPRYPDFPVELAGEYDTLDGLM